MPIKESGKTQKKVIHSTQKTRVPVKNLDCFNCTRVAQKVMPHISFLGNYLIRIYETHAQYN